MLSKRHRAVLDMVGLLVFEVGAVWGVHRVGTRPYVRIEWHDLGGWLTATPVEQIVVSVVWLVALVLAWWTLCSTLLYLAVRARGVTGGRIVERLAFPVVRRVVDRAVATTLVTSALFGAAPAALATEPPAPLVAQHEVAQEYQPRPAGREDDDRGAGGSSSEDEDPPGPQRRAPRPLRPVPDDEERPSDSWQQPESSRDRGAGEGKAVAGSREDGASEDRALGRGEAPAGDRAARGDGDEAGGRRERAERRDADDDDGRAGRADADGRHGGGARGGSIPRAGGRYTVKVGDHLWKIAVQVVSADGGAADRNAVAGYWADLVRSATPGLRSGDPNLIYPGEVLELPPLHASGVGDDRRRP